MRQITWSLIFFILATGFSLFQLKYKVLSLEKENKNLERQCQETEETLHILKAEWEHLNDPPRLQELAERYLTGLSSVNAKQIIEIRNIIRGDIHYDQGSLDALIQQLADEEQRKNEE